MLRYATGSMEIQVSVMRFELTDRHEIEMALLFQKSEGRG